MKRLSEDQIIGLLIYGAFGVAIGSLLAFPFIGYVQHNQLVRAVETNQHFKIGTGYSRAYQDDDGTNIPEKHFWVGYGVVDERKIEIDTNGHNPKVGEVWEVKMIHNEARLVKRVKEN